ncbi:hypothetical protein PQC57_gp112 [Escherichia phage vB_EcoP_WFI101126]|uniref:Uncharacterized protein n=1 Tax=Escherichia phage vB_EcoP_WFI101126 TaxID=2508203 RepID=A0A482MTF8_9CAUD|nr:hypothetical protein PQC57_gp112 [Escherichia phage vB_EcoP_WFI101126]QBQ76563.1 hypothetical protein WFI101126_00136 [Escherichia phage vB_EcoP_WFI101126]
MSKAAINQLNKANESLSSLGLSVGSPDAWMENESARKGFKNSVMLACLIINSTANALQCEDESTFKENGFTDMQDAINCYIQANLDSWNQKDWPESCRDVKAELSRLSVMVEAWNKKTKKQPIKPTVASKIMKSVNLASYALVAAIGVSALVTSLSDKAVASPAPATDAASVFSSSINKGWMICNGADSDGSTIVLKMKFSNVTNNGVLFQSKTLDNQPNNDLVLKRTDSDSDMVTFGTVQRYEDVKAVTNLVSYGPVNESMIATTVYNNADNAVYTVHVNLANCIKASK